MSESKLNAKFVKAKELADRYDPILEELKCKPKPIDQLNKPEDTDYNILLTLPDLNGMKAIITFDGDDPSFVRIVLPNFYPENTIEKDKLPKVLFVMSKVNQEAKGVKLFLSPQGDDVSASVEFLDPRGENGVGTLSKENIERYLSMLMNGFAKFRIEFFD